MNCLKDYIGIKGCGGVTPASGQYINQLPGISMQSIQKIADSEQVTYLGVWSDVQDRAWTRFSNDLYSRLSSKFNIKSKKDFLVIKLEEDGQETISDSSYTGVLIDAGKDKNGFFGIFVDEISIDLLTDKNVTVYFLDKGGKELKRSLIEGVVGLNKKSIQEMFPVSKLFIAIKEDGTFKNTDVTEESKHSCLCLLPKRSSGVHAAYSDAQNFEVQTGNNTAGLSVRAYATCEIMTTVCKNKELFTSAWMYVLGIELMLERMYSPKINKLTTVDAADAEGLRDVFTIEYEKSLSRSVKGLRIDREDSCIECAEQITRRERIGG